MAVCSVASVCFALAGLDVPEDYRLVRAGGGERIAVLAKREGVNRGGVPLEDNRLPGDFDEIGLEAAEIPEANCIIDAGGGECLAIGRKGDSESGGPMVRHGGEQFAGLQIPDADRAVLNFRAGVADGGGPFAVRRDGDRVDDAGMAFEMKALAIEVTPQVLPLEAAQIGVLVALPSAVESMAGWDLSRKRARRALSVCSRLVGLGDQAGV